MTAFERAWSVVKDDDSWTGTHYGVPYEIFIHTDYDAYGCNIYFEWDTVSEDFSSVSEAHAWARSTIEDQVF